MVRTLPGRIKILILHIETRCTGEMARFQLNDLFAIRKSRQIFWNTDLIFTLNTLYKISKDKKLYIITFERKIVVKYTCNVLHTCLM